MKAVLVDEAFSDPDWIYEVKLDGGRCLAFMSRGNVRLLTRNQKLMNVSYQEIVESLEAQDLTDVIIDGEVVAFDDDVPSFSRLQRRMHVSDPARARSTGVAVFFYVFDILHVDGGEVTQVPLRARKSLLRTTFSFDDHVLRFVEHRNEHGEKYFREICAKPGWEGLIAKRADSTYKPTRSRDWLKFKCANEQEFVIGGFIDPQGSREGFGALLVGVYEGDDFVKPDLMAQVGFAEWTGDGRLRHPRFLGLRRDKLAREVVRETPRSP